jgi:C-terminal processing protease CtpA/Prc
MKMLKLFHTTALIVLLALSLCDCTAPETEPTARPIAASGTPTAIGTTVAPTPTSLPTAAPTEAAANQEYREVFEAVWNTVDGTFYDPDFGGLDWEAVHDAYEPLIAAAEDDETLYQLLNQMLWELNVSHTGVGPTDMWPSIEPVAWAEGEIGVDVRLLDGRAVITRVEIGSPAEGAGLRPGFVIQSIDGVSVEGILADAQEHLTPPYNGQGQVDGLTRRMLGRIYGDPETCVKLAYLDEKDILHEACIERIGRQRRAPMAGMPLPPAYLEFESWRLDNGIGYMRFNTFHPDLIPDMVAAIAALQDAPGMIIDLRGNPGGDGGTGRRLAAQFLDGNASFGSLKTRTGTVEWNVLGESVYAGPVVTLIDALSYSCSEWFASGMQATGRAMIIGERSPGGTTGMNARTLPNGAILGYPVGQLLAADGRVLEGYGVIPDIAVSLDRGQLLEGIDAQLQAGIDYILDGLTQGNP